MKRLAIPLSILAAATLVACSSNRSPAPSTISSAAPIVPQKVTYRPGTGVVQNVLLAPAPISAVSGGTATGASGHVAGPSSTVRPEPPVGVPSSSSGRLVRLAIKMDSGGDLQYIDTDSSQFTKGTRVELTPDGMIKKL
jgi:outer membrane lipoprotein SlyB